MLAAWPRISARWPFLNPLTVGEFSRAEINTYLSALADAEWSARG